MFEALIEKQRIERLNSETDQYSDGIQLYIAFKEALEAHDAVRSPKLAVRLDSWYDALKTPQKEDFTAILVQKRIIDPNSQLGKAITTFNGRLSKPSEAI